MNGVVLKSGSSKSDDGVTINSNLKPSAQCQKAAGTASNVLWRKSFQYRDEGNYLKLFKT